MENKKILTINRDRWRIQKGINGFNIIDMIIRNFMPKKCLYFEIHEVEIYDLIAL